MKLNGYLLLSTMLTSSVFAQAPAIGFVPNRLMVAPGGVPTLDNTGHVASGHSLLVARRPRYVAPVPLSTANQASGYVQPDANSTMSGQSFQSTGSNIKRTFGDAAADIIPVHFFGARGDGSIATLLSLYPSLAAAQLVYPHATSLSETQDTAGLLEAIAFGCAKATPGDLVRRSASRGVLLAQPNY